MTFKTVAKTCKISLTKNGLSKRRETRFSFLVPKGKNRRQTHTILEFQICGPLRSNTRYLYFPIF